MATFYASKTGEVSAREKEHSALVRELAGECMTLLENDGTLPLAGAGKVAVYGNGVRHTVKGGTGSGDVNTRTVVTIEQGLKEAGFEILTGKWLDEYDKVLADAQAAYQAELAKKAEELHVPIFAVMFSEVFAQPDVPVITEKEDTDTAIYVLSRNSGEGADRYNRACDYLLGENELADIAYLAEHYEKTVLILNIANLVDTTELKKIKGLNAILLAGQAGNATGNIVADVVLGKSIPSGKLTDTWAASYEDYPSSKNFSHNNGDTNDEYYSDGIYVGYLTGRCLSDAEKQQLLAEGHTEFWEVAGETEDVIVFAALPFRDSAVALRLFRNTADGSVEAAIGTEVRSYQLTIHYLCPACRAKNAQ